MRSNFRKEIGELYRFAGEINKEFFYDDFTADGRLTRPVVGTLHIEQTAGGGINICTEGARICLNPDSVSIFSNKSIAIRSEESIDLRAKGVISMAVGDSAMNMTSKEINLAAVARAVAGCMEANGGQTVTHNGHKCRAVAERLDRSSPERSDSRCKRES